MFSPRLAALLALVILLFRIPLKAQTVDRGEYSRKNSFGVFAEYSNDSSHILLGQAANRKLLTIGASYSRRLLSRQALNLQYLAEIRPAAFEIDPLVHLKSVFTTSMGVTSNSIVYAQASPCRPLTLTFTGTIAGSNPPATYTAVDTYTCGRRQWTFAEGLSPLGTKLNFLPRRRLQPVFTILGGYMFSTRSIPIEQAGSFNFTLEIGAGLELFHPSIDAPSRFGQRSLRLEYRYHHLSNGFTAQENPGIDNGLLQVTCAFGR